MWSVWSCFYFWAFLADVWRWRHRIYWATLRLWGEARETWPVWIPLIHALKQWYLFGMAAYLYTRWRFLIYRGTYFKIYEWKIYLYMLQTIMLIPSASFTLPQLQSRAEVPPKVVQELFSKSETWAGPIRMVPLPFMGCDLSSHFELSSRMTSSISVNQILIGFGAILYLLLYLENTDTSTD